MLRGTLLRRTTAEAKIPKKTSKKMTSLRSIVRACLLALLAASFAGAIGSLRAQEQPATPQTQQQSEATRRHSVVSNSNWYMRSGKLPEKRRTIPPNSSSRHRCSSLRGTRA